MNPRRWLIAIAGLLPALPAAATAPPSLTAHPISQRVPAGTWVELVAEAAFDPALKWSWRKNGELIPNETSNRLPLRNATLGTTAEYWAVASNASGETWSRTARVDVVFRGPEPGALDLTFGDQTRFGTSTYAVLPQPDGGLIVGGDFTGIGPRSIGRLARLGADGKVDTAFNAGGFGANDIVRTLAPSADGKFYAAGRFTTYNGQPCPPIVRLLANGQRDDTFSPVIPEGTAEIRAAVELADGTIVASGIVGNPAAGYWLKKWTLDGQEAGSFFPPPIFNGRVNTIFAMADGRLVVAGTFRQNPSGAAGQFNRIVRLNADGSLDPGWTPPSGAAGGANAEVRAVAVLEDGRIVVGGAFTSVNGTPRSGLARLLADGTLDAGWNPAPDDFVSTLLLRPGGTLFAGGLFTRIGGVTVRGVARLDAETGATDPAFRPPPIDGEVLSVALANDNQRLAMGGLFELPHAVAAKLHLDPPAPAPPSSATLGGAAGLLPSGRSRLTVTSDGWPTPEFDWFRDDFFQGHSVDPEWTAMAPGRWTVRAVNSSGSVVSEGKTVTASPLFSGARSRREFDGAVPSQAGLDFGTTLATALVTDATAIDELRVTLSVDHVDASQLSATLTSPAGTVVALFTKPGKRGANLKGTLLGDAATRSIKTGVAPFAGSYKPEAALSAFGGQAANGVWTLRLTDNRLDGSSPTLRSWSLEIFGRPPTVSYRQWATFYLGGDTGGGDPAADANADGFTNAVAFALAQSPFDPPLTRFRSGLFCHRRWTPPVSVAIDHRFSTDFDHWLALPPTESWLIRYPNQTEDVFFAPPPLPDGRNCFWRITAQ